MKKNFDIDSVRKNYFKNFMSINQFLTIQTDVIFQKEFRQAFIYDNNSIELVYKNTIKCGEKLVLRKYSFVYVFVNGKDLFSLRDVEFQSLSFIEFLDMLVKHTSNNFVDSYFLNQKIQMSLGDYGL